MKLFLEIIAIVAALFGMGIVRAGFFGEYLGRAWMASHVRFHPDAPQWYHRLLTVALGALVIFVASAAFTLLIESAR
ncbi:MAG TPA: hypothetical protein VMJ93_16305 [Verrucomicrobiae bacterium]|nr:hypothetical protein [Verrucomicrobiae bacterium]